jgi:hypothetical protein
MPTKSGRIKLEDVRQGKTVWVAYRHDTIEPYIPTMFVVQSGPKLRVVGMKPTPDGAWESVVVPVVMLYEPYYGITLIQQWHPRSSRIIAQRDGSYVFGKGFTSRNRCQRMCDDLNRGGKQRYWVEKE